MLIQYGKYAGTSNRTAFQRSALLFLIAMICLAPANVAANDLLRPKASIESVTPTTVQAGDVLTIQGRNLNTSGAIRVQQDACAIISWTGDQITCRIPSTITDGSSRLELTTAVRDYVEGPMLRFVAHRPMERSGRSPYLSQVGSIGVESMRVREDGGSPRQLVLSGHGFGASQASSLVRVRGLAAEIVSWSDGRIVFHAPTSVLPAGWHDVVLSIRSLDLDAGQFGLRPHLKAVTVDASQIILHGAFFGEAGESGQVVFGDMEQGRVTDIVHWSATEIVARIPPSLPAGAHSISVWKDGIGGNRVPLDIGARITDVRPQAVYPGQEVTIRGANFSSRDVEAVHLEGRPVRVVRWDRDTVRVTIPEGIRSGNRRLVLRETGTAPLATNVLVLQKTAEQDDPRWDTAHIDRPW